MQQFEDIYETLLGLRVEEARVPGVPDAFAPGSVCAERYDQMRQIYGRLCTRLNAGEEDPDLDALIGAMEAIQKELCRTLYQIQK